MIRKKREKTLVTKIKNDRGEITADPKDVKKDKREHY